MKEFNIKNKTSILTLITLTNNYCMSVPEQQRDTN